MALALLIEAILLYFLLRTIIEPPVKKREPEGVTFALTPPGSAPKAEAASASSKKSSVQAAREKQIEPPTAPVVPPVVPPTQPRPPVQQGPYVKLSEADMAAGDISKIPSQRGSGAGEGKNSGTAYGPGEGPGGQPLYNAEWFRRPTDAEMAFYLPARRSPGMWGMIACQTIPDNRVENCRSLSESPGSGMSSALRQASWQFRVRPPRIGNRPVIGAWVRIKFSITDKGDESSEDDE